MIESVGPIAAAAGQGFKFGLLGAAFLFGFRHGIDWDHIAAITDITSSQDDRRKALQFGTLYALGHAVVVLTLGLIAIVIGRKLPGSVDEVMARVVGATLLVLGVYVFASLIRHGRDFRMRSRWMLIFTGVRRGARWVRGRMQSRSVEARMPVVQSRERLVEATVPGVGAEPGAQLVRANPGATAGVQLEGNAPSLWHHGHHGLPGHHHHRRPEPDDTFMNYGRLTSFGVGMIHGIGAETPTQLLIFLGAATSSVDVGVLTLFIFIAGLLVSNTVITMGSTLGYLRASKNFAIYATVAVITGVFSLTIGTIFVLGKTSVLPAIFGG